MTLIGLYELDLDIAKMYQHTKKLFIYLFKIDDRRILGPLILPEVHKNKLLGQGFRKLWALQRRTDATENITTPYSSVANHIRILPI